VLVHVGERRVEHVHDLLVERADDVAQLPLRLADVLDLGLEEPVALAELGQFLHGERVDRPDGGQLRLELCRPGRRVDPLGESGGGRAQRVVGSTPELAAQRLDHRLASDGRLHQVQLGLLEPAARGGQLVLTDRPLPAQLLQPGAPRPDRIELAPVPVAQRRQQGVQCRLRLGHHAQQPFDRGGVGLEPGPALGRLLTLLGVPGQAPLDLGQALGQHPPPFGQARGAHLPLGTGRGGRGDPSVDPAAILPGGRHPGGGLHPLVLERGHAGDQLGHPAGVAGDALLQLGPVPADLLELGAEQVPVTRHPLATDPRRLMGHLVPVVGPDRLGRLLAAGVDPGTGRGALLGGTGGLHPGHVGPGPGLVDHGGGDHAASGPDPPSGG
jgi:hypothetical protein